MMITLLNAKVGDWTILWVFCCDHQALVQNDLKSTTETCQELHELLNAAQAEVQTAMQQGDMDRRQHREQMAALENEIESLREKMQEKEDVAVSGLSLSGGQEMGGMAWFRLGGDWGGTGGNST